MTNENMQLKCVYQTTKLLHNNIILIFTSQLKKKKNNQRINVSLHVLMTH